jgi:hypothetical protein
MANKRNSIITWNEDNNGKPTRVPLFIIIPTLATVTVTANDNDHEITYRSYPIEESCGSSISSYVTVGSANDDRWMSSSSKDQQNSATVKAASAAAPRFPRRLCSDLSADNDHEIREGEESIPKPPQLGEHRSLGEDSSSHHDYSPRLPQRTWILPISLQTVGMESNSCSFHDLQCDHKPESFSSISPRLEDLEAPAALAA